jgi:hypothetical protein
VARAEAAPEAAEASLGDALATFTSVEARFEVARTRLDLADLAAAGGDPARAAAHLDAARALFTALGAPLYAERAEAAAARLASVPRPARSP